MACLTSVDMLSVLYERGMHHIIHHIFSYLDPYSLKSIENTSLMWREVIEAEKVWQKLFSKSKKVSADWRRFNSILENSYITMDPNNNDTESNKCVLLYEAVKTYENNWSNREGKVEKLAFMKRELKISTMDHFQMNENYIAFFLRESHLVKILNRWTLEQQCVLKMPNFEIGDTIRLGETFIVSVEDEAYHIMDFTTKKSTIVSEDPEDNADEKQSEDNNDSWYSLDSTAGPSINHLCVNGRLMLSVVNIPDLRDSNRSLESHHQSQHHLILRKIEASLDAAIIKRTIIQPEISVLNMDLDENNIAIVALVKPRHWIRMPAGEEQGSWELRVLSTSSLDTLYCVSNWPSVSLGLDHFACGFLVTIINKSLWVWNIQASFAVYIVDSSPIISACILSSKYIATTNSARKLKIWELHKEGQQSISKPSVFCCLDANLIPGFPRSHKQIAIIGGDKYQIIIAARDVFKYSLYGDGLSKFYRINFLPQILQTKSPVIRVLDLPHDIATRQRTNTRRNSAPQL